MERETLLSTPMTPPEPSLAEGSECPIGISHNQWKLLKRAMPARPVNSVSDIDLYLDSPQISWDPANPIYRQVNWVLTWWKTHTFEFPLMAKAARDLLAVPGSEVDCERLFCGGKDQLGIWRFSLNGETMRWLTILKSYFERKLNDGKAKLPEV